MKYFKMSNSSFVYPVSRNLYEELTEKRTPYYQYFKGKIRYFAICPGCGNPINFINLYSEDSLGENGIQKTHARHYCYSVPNIAKFNKKALISCPFYKRNASRIFVRTASKTANSEVVTLMKEYRKELKDCLEEILGFKLSEQQFFKFVGDFIDAKGFYFSGISKWNLPYYFLFLLPNEHVYNCVIKDKEIREAVSQRSFYFSLSSKFRLRKSVKEFAELEFVIGQYRRNGQEEFLSYKLVERLAGKDKSHLLLNKDIKIDSLLLVNRIANR